MAKTATNQLDADELLHLAIRASESGQHEESLSCLKRALEQAPKNGKIHYMLGAEHAQIGLYDRAAEDMAKAVELEPELYTAHFQLGLLHITSGRVAQAESVWTALDKLSPDHPLYLFKTGMLHLARDEFDQCAQNLKRGISLNTSNAALNNDMQRILGEIDKTSGPTGTAPAVPPKVAPPAHSLLSAYRENRQEEKE
jgi:tetratricopeptide (TPR) repeat protein